MYTFEIAEQVSLVFLIAYYGNHFLHRLRIAWRRVRHQLKAYLSLPRSWYAVAILFSAFALQGCIEASPIVFYGLHLGAELIHA